MGELRGRRKRANAVVGERPQIGQHRQRDDDNPLGPLHQGVGNGAVGALVENPNLAMGRAMGDALDRMMAQLPQEPERSKANADAAPLAVSGDRPRWQLWPSKDAQRLDLFERGELKLPRAEGKQLRKDAARIRRDAQGMWDMVRQICADHPEWLDDRAMRLETPWTLQMLKDVNLGPAYFTLAEIGDNSFEELTREINTNELAKSRMKQVRQDNERGGDRYDLDYDDWALEELEEKLEEAERDQQIKHVLDATEGDHEGMIISESHGDESSWRFLYEQMPSMRDSEVMTLYLEHFRNSEYQPMLDAYFAGGPDEPMPRGLQTYIKKFDNNHGLKTKYSLMGVVTRAKEFGLRIVGIDDMSAKRGSKVVQGDQLESRAARMNVIAEAIVAQDQQRFGKHKFVMLMGAKHTHDHGTGEDTEFPDGIAGVAQLLNLIAVRVGDEDKLTIHRRGEE